MDQLHTIEIALSEWLLAGPGDPERLPASATDIGGSSAVQASLLSRIRLRVDRVLSDSQLTPESVATYVGVSTRTLQKLFGTSGETFTHYLRRRRLERCRSDLANPLLLHLSIWDIGSRWGFSDAAHFSRAFREQYQCSPRAYRRESGAALSKRVWLSAARVAESGSDFDPASPVLLETTDAWVLSIEAQAVQLLGSATTLLYHRMAQTLTNLQGSSQEDARSTVESGMEIVITPGIRSWQVRGTLRKSAIRQGNATPRSVCSS